MAANYFERGEIIEEGAFGKVFLCFHKRELGKKYAMKVIDLTKSSKDKRYLAETEKEANLLTTLQHQFILHAVSVFQDRATLCIVTEFCDKGDLETFLSKRKGHFLEEHRIVEWFWQICSALEYLHGRNILHRDIKTQNIFLTGDEMTIKLGDLGLAKVLESSMQNAMTFCGTPFYMSPEILAFKPYNSKSDIWAMGVCVYEMTTLRRPFDERLIHELISKISHGQLPPMPKDEYSPRLIKIIERMLCRDTNSRPSAAELQQDVLFKKQQTSKMKKKKSILDDDTSYRHNDLQQYRWGYPSKKDQRELKDNLKFYKNELRSYPDGDYIENIHKDWWGDYQRLERHHGYIDWLFPIREPGMNIHAQELQCHEINGIMDDAEAFERVLKSYEMMLDFYGMELDPKTGRITRACNWKRRFQNLNRSHHNYLYITRILKFLGEFGYESYKRPFVEFVLEEAMEHGTLIDTLESCVWYWLETIKSEKDREELKDYVRKIESGYYSPDVEADDLELVSYKKVDKMIEKVD